MIHAAHSFRPDQRGYCTRSVPTRDDSRAYAGGFFLFSNRLGITETGESCACVM